VRLSPPAAIPTTPRRPLDEARDLARAEAASMTLPAGIVEGSAAARRLRLGWEHVEESGAFAGMTRTERIDAWRAMQSTRRLVPRPPSPADARYGGALVKGGEITLERPVPGWLEETRRRVTLRAGTVLAVNGRTHSKRAHRIMVFLTDPAGRHVSMRLADLHPDAADSIEICSAGTRR
jgi:hypothetical protein